MDVQYQKERNGILGFWFEILLIRGQRDLELNVTSFSLKDIFRRKRIISDGIPLLLLRNMFYKECALYYI